MGFEWNSKKLNTNLRRLPVQVDQAVATAVEFNAARGETYMKTHAPWTDRTSAARNGLFTLAFHLPFVRHEILFSHAVAYGIWLEVANDERFAILLESIKVTGDDTMKQLEGLFGRLK